MWYGCCQHTIPACLEMSIDVVDGQVGECSTLPTHGGVLIELSHGPSSSGYVYDLVPMG